MERTTSTPRDSRLLSTWRSRDRRPLHIASLATAGAVAFAAPLALAAAPASADSTNDAQASLTFVNLEDETVTCSLLAVAVLTTDSRTGAANQGATRNGAHDASCVGDHRMSATYEDAEGDTQGAHSFGLKTFFISAEWSGVRSDLSVTHEVTFTNCDTQASATCNLTVTTSAPK